MACIFCIALSFASLFLRSNSLSPSFFVSCGESPAFLFFPKRAAASALCFVATSQIHAAPERIAWSCAANDPTHPPSSARRRRRTNKFSSPAYHSLSVRTSGFASRTLAIQSQGVGGDRDCQNTLPLPPPPRSIHFSGDDAISTSRSSNQEYAPRVKR